MNENQKAGALGIATLVCGIVGLLGVFLLSYVALALGFVSWNLVKGKDDTSVKVMASIGFVLGSLGVLVNLANHFS